MTTKREFLNELDARMVDLPESERTRLREYFTEMIDDRIEAGMSEEAAVSALGAPGELLRDIAPAAEAMPAALPAKGSAAYSEAIREIHIHLKNADGRVLRAPLPDGMTAQINASERDSFTWSLTDGVLTVAEAADVRRSLFRRGRTLTLILPELVPERLIVDSYGGDIALDGVGAGELAVLSTASGDVGVRRFACAGRAELTSRSGDIAVDEAEAGQLKVESLSGDVGLRRVRAGGLRVRTASGDVDGGLLRAETAAIGTTSGDVELDDISARQSLLCETASGDADLRRAESADLRVSTTGGDVGLRLLDAVDGWSIAADTRSGDVSLPEGWTPPASPAARAVVRTVSGDIRISIV